MATMELTNGEQLKATQDAVSATNPVNNGLVQRLLKCKNDEHNSIGIYVGRLHQLELEIVAYMNTGNKLRVVELEEMLAAVIAEGQQAEAELAKATQSVMIARQQDAELENWHNRASVAVKVAKDNPLPRFYKPEDEAAKAAAIAIAEADLNNCLDAMASRTLGVPFSLQQQQQAQAKVGKLVAKAKALRNELAALQGKAVQSTGAAVESPTGLIG